MGYQWPLSGEGYAGIIVRWSIPDYREYLQAPLNQPLEAGTWYTVEYWVSLADSTCGIEHIDVHFSSAPIAENTYLLDKEPHIRSLTGFLSDTTNWVRISGCYLAEGGEAYITIGNFNPDQSTPTDPDCGTPFSYYYLEDVVVTERDPPDEIPLELGDPVFACFSHQIDPQHDGPFFFWSDGSQEPTLSVTQSGTYTLTVTDGCRVGIDSVEVTIGGFNPPVDLGPEEVAICEGDSFSADLDPELATYFWSTGATGADYALTTAGTYSVTLDDGCTSSSDQIEIVVLYPPASFSLGEDQLLCEGNAIEIGHSADGVDYQWQDGQTTSHYLVTGPGTYALTITNACGQATDEINITPLAEPDVDLGPAVQQICPGESLMLHVDPDLGEIVWQDGSADADYVVSVPGVYTVFVSNECGVGSDQVEVVFGDLPDVALGPDLVSCPGDTVTLEADNPGSTYMWQDGSEEAHFAAVMPGVYSVTVTNSCGADADTILLMTPSPLNSPDLGPDTSICPGEQLMLNAGNPGVTVLWQDLSEADTFLVTMPGVYWVQVTNGCTTISDTIFVAMANEPPMLELPDTITLCLGHSIVLDGGTFTGEYLWSDGSQLQQLAVATAGVYSLTVTTPCGTGVDSVVVLGGGPAPQVDLGPDAAICPGDTLTLMPGFAEVDTWQWPDGSAQPTFVVSTQGEVVVAVGNTCGMATDTVLISLLPDVPLIDLGPDTALCPGEQLELMISLPDVTISWPDGSDSPAYSVSTPGDIIVMVSNSCGMSTDTIGIEGLPGIPILDLGSDPSLCPGESYLIDPGMANVTYVWQDGSTGTTFLATEPGVFVLTVSNSCGSSTDTLQIIGSTEGPQVELGPDRQACEGDTVTLHAGISGVSYLWQDGSMASSYTVVQSGTYSLQVSNSCGSDSDTVLVDISGIVPMPDLGPDTLLCAGETFILSSAADAETSVQWQDGSWDPTYTVTLPGSYILTETNRCGTGVDSVLVMLADIPETFTFGPDTILCQGQSLQLSSPEGDHNITWQDGSHGNQFLVVESGTYSLLVENICGSVTDDIIIEFDTRVAVVELASSVDLCPGEHITLDATQSGEAEYQWSTGVASPSIEVHGPGIYTVEVTMPCGQTTGTVEVGWAGDCQEQADIYLPNVFSPNDDGVNDFYAVTVGDEIELLEIRGTIYDRWGNLVFQSSELPFRWDGTFSGKPLQPGVYACLLILRYEVKGIERVQEIATDITLLR